MRQMFLFIVLAIGLSRPAAVAAADLTVVVTSLASDEGDVHIAIYDDPAGFPKGDDMLFEIQSRIKGGVASATFTSLEPGHYAVAIFHDANANDEFDQAIFGIPLEDFGFSNEATAVFSAPSFEEARIRLPPKGTSITIAIDH